MTAGEAAPLLDEGRKVLTIEKASGPALISADIHGNWRDFERLRALFLESEARGEAPLWISLGDWVHGPAEQRRRDVTDARGQPLYDYPDQTPAILEHLFALMDRYPGRVVSLCGNHEHAHIGGYRTGKFHGDEAGFLEAQMSAEQVADMRRRFATWPILVRLASCGVVLSHGAPEAGSVEEYEQLLFQGPCPRRDLLFAAMSRYGFPPGQDRALLQALSEDRTYDLLLHGHDREEEGFSPTGPAALLLCTSFGARQPRKTYAWLDLAHRYTSMEELHTTGALRRLWPELPDI